MAIDRPTFSETWYRVAELRPKLRSTVQAFRQHFRGRTYHVLQDNSSNQYFRLDDAGYFFVGLLDGSRTVSEVWDTCNEKLGDRSPTQGEAIQLLSQLYSSNLLSPDLPPDASTLFDRQRKRVAREVRGYIANLLFARIPIWDPDRFLERWVPIGGLAFTWAGFAVWLGLIVAAFWALAGRWEELFSASQSVIAPENLPLLYLCFGVIKAIHELGHGFSCKKFGLDDHSGGEVHTLGIMLLVLVPVPYVDASSAWALRSKWKRALVGAAGMYVELAVAALAALTWANVSSGLVSQVAYNVMFIASVSTILFNANPLLRFDGYYILSDVAELPNLYQRSKDYVYYLVRKYVYAVRAPLSPARSGDEKPWLVLYCVAAFIYRIIISVSIILFIANQLFVVGMALAIATLIGWLVVPLVKFGHYLAVGPELWRTRRRAVLWTLGTAAVIIGFIALVPFPDRARAEGIVDFRLEESVYVEDGFIERVLPSGTAVAPERLDGEGSAAGVGAGVASIPLVIAENRQLIAERDMLRAQIAETMVTYRDALRENQALAQALEERRIADQAQLDNVEKRLSDLRPRATVAGRWLTKHDDLLPGRFATRTEPVGVVGTLDDLVIAAVTDQYLGPRLSTEVGAGRTVEVRVRGNPNLSFTGVIEKIEPAAQHQLPSAALGISAGGNIAVDPKDSQGLTTTDPFFLVNICPDPQSPVTARLLPKQRVVVRFTMNDWRPLGAQWYRALRQLIQRRFAS